jgi:hypothetical protein
MFHLIFNIMGIIKQGILGGLSGKVGNVVGSSWKGINYLRALPTKVANPNTVGQRITRTKMSIVINFLKTCTAFIRFGFSGFALKMSAFNAATSFNFRIAVGNDYPNQGLDYTSVKVTRGNLPGAVNAHCAAVEPGKISIGWEDNSSQGNASQGDTPLLLVYCPDASCSVYRMQTGARSEGSALLDVPASFIGKEVHCYIGFANMAEVVGSKLRDYISDSAYAGSINVL